MSNNTDSEKNTVIIPAEGVTEITNSEYKDNTDLVHIIIREGVTKIEYKAFKGCSNLVSVKLPSTLTKICSSAFYNCSKLSDITLPDHLSELESHVFYGCSSLKKITIPDTITLLKDNIFEECSGLEDITLPKNINYLSFSLFRNATSLKKINLPQGVKKIGIAAFEGCTSLTSIQLPDAIEEIAYSAFNGCTSLSDIKLPYSLKALGDSVFWNCPNLKKVELPPHLSSIGGDSFPKETEIIISPENQNLKKENDMILSATGKDLFFCSSNEENITIPSSVTTIGNRVFAKNQHIKNITIPHSVKSLGKYCFDSCSSLKTVVLENGVEEIMDQAFYQCTQLESISFPISLKHIRKEAFKNCTSLKEVNIPLNVKKIDEDSFNSSGVTQLTIDSTCELGRNAFNKCTNLTTAVLACKNISEYAFYGCSSLLSVIFQKTVERVTIGAFYNCRSLKTVHIAYLNKTIDGQYFIEHNSDCDIRMQVESSWMNVTKSDFNNVRELAKQGDAKAQKELGDYYYKGEGTKKDYAAAAKCYLLSAKQGYLPAQWSMVLCYTNGKGVECNDRLAFEWARIAAKQGHSGAQTLIGDFYSNGKYVMRDYEKAAKWYRKAAKNGNETAEGKLKHLTERNLILPPNAVKQIDETFGTIIFNGKNRWICKTTNSFVPKETPFDIELEGTLNEGITDSQRKAYADYLQKKDIYFEEVQQKAKQLYRGANRKTRNQLIPLALYIDRMGNYGWRCHKAWGGTPNAVILSDGPIQMAEGDNILYNYDKVIASRTNKNWHIGDSTYLNLFGEITEVNICTSGEEEMDEELTKEETELLMWLTTELDTETIKQKVLDYCNNCYDMWSDKKIEAEDLFDEISINSIYINVKFAAEIKHIPDIFLTGECEADEDHGISIGFRNKKFMIISEEGDAF